MIATTSIWITLMPIIIINSILLISLLLYSTYFSKKKTQFFEGAKNQGSLLLSQNIREWWFWTTDPVVKLLVALHIGPNTITLIGISIAAIAGIFFGLGQLGYAGWLMILSASFDIFDGRVARMTGKTSSSGAFFDSVTDRFGEGFCFMGLAYYFRDTWLLLFIIAGLIGSTLVSYTRARGEGVGVNCTKGWMQRPERIAYLGVASILTPMMHAILMKFMDQPPAVLVYIALIFIAITTNITAVYRMIYIMNELDSQKERDTDSFAQVFAKLTTSEGRDAFLDRARYGYDRAKTDINHAVIFHVGYINQDELNYQISAGNMPHLSKHILERGGKYTGTSVFPSSIGPSFTPWVTGSYPGTCDIPATRWFDRHVSERRKITVNRFRDYMGWGAYAMDHDLNKTVQTIFEYSKQAVTIFGALNRGCGLMRDPAFFRLYSRYHNAIRMSDIEAADEAAFSWFSSALKRETDFILYSFPPMALLHTARENNDIYAKLDQSIGKCIQNLEEKNIYDDSMLFFVADAGFDQKTHSFNLYHFLNKRYQVCPKNDRFKDWQDADIIYMPSGTSMAHLYFPNQNKWQTPCFFESIEQTGLIGSLLENDGIDIIAGRSAKGGIMLQSRRGRAHILEDAANRWTYLIKGSDPFGYTHIDQSLNTRQAFEQTVHTDYPDAIMQIAQLFRSKRTGDLVISATHHTSLLDKSQVKTMAGIESQWACGSIHKSHMQIPILCSHALRSSYCRSVDIFPSIAQALGIDIMHAVDGESIL